MRAVFAALVCVVAAAHFAFLAYLPIGGLLALRWRWTVGVHAVAVLWAFGSVVLHFWCPLTAIERWARSHAGMGPLSPAGFIDHYITGVAYPSWAAGHVQAAGALVVALSWLLLAARRRRCRSTGPRTEHAKPCS